MNHLVSNAGIRTQDVSNVSLLSWPLNQGSVGDCDYHFWPADFFLLESRKLYKESFPLWPNHNYLFSFLN